jgi:hypothetical protein
MELLDDINWQYATKKYHLTLKVSQKNIDKRVRVIRSASTFSGLQQAWIMVESNPEIKEKPSPKVLNPKLW